MSNGPLYAMGGAHPHALERNDAMKGLATGNRTGKPVERKQEILTPACIADFARVCFGGGISLDPCAALEPIEDHVRADRRYHGPAEPHAYVDGLLSAWSDRTYCNPPYKDLKAWLAKTLEEELSGKRIIVLCPVRSNRKWWREAYHTARESFVLYLNPLKFVGYSQAFPAPLCLLAFNIGASQRVCSEAIKLGGFA